MESNALSARRIAEQQLCICLHHWRERDQVLLRRPGTYASENVPRVFEITDETDEVEERKEPRAS